MKADTKQPEETETPETEKAWRLAQQNALGTGSVWWLYVANAMFKGAQSLELRALAAEKERDELREMLRKFSAVSTMPKSEFRALLQDVSAILTRTKPTQ